MEFKEKVRTTYEVAHGRPWFSVSHLPFDCVEAAGVYRVIQIANSKPYVTLSANRHEFDWEENKRRNAELLRTIKEKGLYAYEQVGGFEEKKDGRKVQVVESSFFVPYRENTMNLPEFIQIFETLRDKYKQDSILIGLPAAYQGYDGDVVVLERGLELKTGQHYYLTAAGTAEAVGTNATIQTFERYGSIAIDPKKNRMIEWVLAGTVQPRSVNARTWMDKMGLLWLDGHELKEIPAGVEVRGYKMLQERAWKLHTD